MELDLLKSLVRTQRSDIDFWGKFEKRYLCAAFQSRCDAHSDFIDDFDTLAMTISRCVLFGTTQTSHIGRSGSEAEHLSCCHSVMANPAMIYSFVASLSESDPQWNAQLQQGWERYLSVFLTK